jgi:1-acyl-sn-glycerol-3-phosphate acyltransferase
MLRTIAFKIALGLWFAAWAPLLVLALPSAWLSRRFIVTDAFGVLWLARKIAGIDYQIFYPPTEQDGVPAPKDPRMRADRKAIIAAKHMSILEVAILVSHVPNAFFIIKRELMWIPVYGWSFWRMGFQPVNRASGKTNMKKLADEVAKKIVNGMTLVIFPEGTRAKPGQKVSLKRGLLFIAEQLKLPIVAVGADTGKYWPKRGRMHGGTAHLHFEPALPFNASLQEISDAIARHSA